jgi:hypothetical protein
MDLNRLVNLRAELERVTADRDRLLQLNSIVECDVRPVILTTGQNSSAPYAKYLDYSRNNRLEGTLEKFIGLYTSPLPEMLHEKPQCKEPTLICIKVVSHVLLVTSLRYGDMPPYNMPTFKLVERYEDKSGTPEWIQKLTTVVTDFPKFFNSVNVIPGTTGMNEEGFLTTEAFVKVYLYTVIV